jgi:hypothetical protein
MLTPIDFERKIKKLKTCENSYTGPLCIIDLKYDGHNEEIRSFGQFLLQTSDFSEKSKD